ncbi:unnamed protein product [Brassicogethes aeneus]|uniref:Uncharacterized protein n=1 Tax=Brassicogethes aeneus TaxID=1431903 RepID=A0A9P0B889_BRAAE|nr:unnamed protein product [Brassicogethes aeneus]
MYINLVSLNLLLKKIRAVIWADAEELLDSVCEQRKLIGNYEIKIMADGGQGFFKICMTILPENYISESNKSQNNQSSDEEDNFESPIKKRKLYSEGGSTGHKAKLTSVHRLIMLCIVPDIQETYDNMKLLFELTNINNIPFKFVSDFKLLLIVNGQQTTTSTCPCPYCFITLNDLRNSESGNNSGEHNIETDADEGKLCSGFETLKTYGHIRKDYDSFSSMHKKKKNAKYCHSTVNLPLFAEDDNM